MEINARVVGTRSRIFPCISAVLLVLLLWLAWRVLLLAFAGIMIGVLLCGVTDFVAAGRICLGDSHTRWSCLRSSSLRAALSGYGTSRCRPDKAAH